ncbi:hypothetical protein M440DRAFT_1238694 [Trichoderma longibrachiatum ATCC 18648]|uniref:Uncharacterized protein n=1 Tax=Trichoderma longibrachiatum ATCC 18648 TaxID=983965 RepID=A0A2T4C5U6_TRILO|nr:hypothetical protein M440DRAFT_1238694 [Trichoderma longibrachiatum ATCC 18648]
MADSSRDRAVAWQKLRQSPLGRVIVTLPLTLTLTRAGESGSNALLRPSRTSRACCWSGRKRELRVWIGSSLPRSRIEWRRQGRAEEGDGDGRPKQKD